MKKSFFVCSRFLCFLFAFLSLSLFFSCSSKTKDKKRLQKVVIYTYDSFTGEWGAADKIAQAFKEETGLDCDFVVAGDGSQLLLRAVMEKKDPQADVVLGLDNNFANAVKKEGIFVPYKTINHEKIKEGLYQALGGEYLMTPYDYSHFALIYDEQSKVPAPTCLEDLLKSEYEKSLILMDPRTSTPGLGFAAWTQAVFKDEAQEFWKKLKPSILTMAPGWSSGYALFQKGEAPLVISYSTSPAAQIEYEGKNTYRTLVFSEGHVMQTEGAGIVKNAPNIEGAKKFLDFLTSKKAQEILPLTQWMYPANKEASLPECYEIAAPILQKTVEAKEEDVEALVDQVQKILNE